ncbi:MAG: pilus assembly protein PilM [Candidatus Kerfeldbacteria bacterium]|nr:pilus assembly protein PilM [Candidatus Kerfeldbacteria bacterium]
MRSIGVNLSDYSVEAVELHRGIFSRLPAVTAISRITLADGIVNNGIILDQPALIAQLQVLWQQARPTPFQAKAVVVSLPESQVFTRLLSFPVGVSRDHIAATLQQQLGHYLPFTNNDVGHNFIQLGQRGQQQDILLVAVPRTILQSYRTLAQTMQWKLVAIELESISSARAVLSAVTPGTAQLLLDIGARTTIVSFFNHTGLLFTFNIPVAGQQLTQQIMKTAKLTAALAEQLKCRDGITGKNATVTTALTTVLASIVSKIQEAKQYVENNYGHTVERIYCIGGTANLPGLMDWLQQQLGQPCGVAQLLASLRKNSTLALLQDDGLVYSNAVGLALGVVAKEQSFSGVNLNTL